MALDDRSDDLDQDKLIPFFLITTWDEALGPKVIEEYPSSDLIKSRLPEYNPLSFSTQIFMVASSLFGSQELVPECGYSQPLLPG